MPEYSRYCQWPAKIAKVKELGYIEDSNERQYPRDIGCSSSTSNGHVVIQFGDTFAHDAQGDFVGVTCSDIAVMKDLKEPQLCSYYGIQADGTIPTNPPVVSGDLDDENYRTTTWCFGGIVFPEPLSGPLIEGYTFFQCSHVNKNKWEEVIQNTGIAKVLLNTSKNEVFMTRSPQTDVFFSISEPRFGSFTAHIADNYVYTYGHAANTKDVMLARVPVKRLLQRPHYEYFDGTSYQKNISKCKPVMTGMQHGKIYRSKLFQPNTGKDWGFIGCNAFGDSKIQMGVASKPEGPWDIRDLMPAPPKTKHEDSSFTYCMYAHPWAYDEADGEVMITWSGKLFYPGVATMFPVNIEVEGGIQGKVVAVKVSLVQAGYS